jgi:thiol-disulfide isomerase/thioredoxin
MSRALNIILVLLILGLIANYLYRKPKFSESEMAPLFEATLIDGSSFALERLRGDYVLLDFWGSWCGPCRRENPGLVQLYDKYGERTLKDGSSFHIVSIALEKSEERWKNAIAKDGLDWPFHIGQMERMKSSLALKYGVREIPTKYLLGKDGQVVGVNMNNREIDQWLSERD